MKRGFFWRLFWAIAAVVLAAVMLLSAVMVTSLRSERQAAYEEQILSQLRTMARLMTQGYNINDLRFNYTLRELIIDQTEEMHDAYNGSVWIVSWQSTGVGVIQALYDDWDTLHTVVYEDVILEQLNLIRAGSEIRAQGLFPELGNSVVTLGVPWYYKNETAVGAVLIHVEAADLMVDLSDLFLTVSLVALGVLAIGVVLAVVIARGQTRPIRSIELAVSDFARGKLDTRVKVRASRELVSLADAFNKMAGELENLETSRREFVANVSHELRSPLTSIQGYLQAISDGAIEPAEQGKYLEVVISETRRLAKLVSQLLDMSRMESGASVLNVSEFDLNELMRRALISFLPIVDSKRIELRPELDESIPKVSGDPDRIRQVANNLIDNAVKFTPESGVIIIKTGFEAGRVSASVSNSGPEISQADLARIFDRFYKVDKAHTSGMGTGLGLSIARKIMEQHGGDLTVASGSGTTSFTFTLAAGEK